MALMIEGQTTFAAPRERVWNALLDPAVMAQCVPGCRELRETDVNTYAADLRIGVGAVSGKYQGTLRIAAQVPPERYAVSFEGSGSQGFVKGVGEAELQAKLGSTLLSYKCEIEIGGLIASVGQRMLEGIGKFLIKQMFTRLQTHIQSTERS